MERLEQLGHRFSHAVEVESSPDEEEPWDPLSEDSNSMIRSRRDRLDRALGSQDRQCAVDS